MRRLILATRNEHKTREMAALLGSGFLVLDLKNIGFEEEIAETAPTFAGNAELKARAVSRFCPEELVVADDSGLEVPAIQGAPGVYSARYAGPRSDDADNVAKLLRELRTLEMRQAAFRCVLVVAQDGRLLETFEGSVSGMIEHEPRGHGGFGYDPVFRPDGFDLTFSQLSAEEKNRVSHRARAAAKLKEFLRGREDG